MRYFVSPYDWPYRCYKSSVLCRVTWHWREDTLTSWTPKDPYRRRRQQNVAKSVCAKLVRTVLRSWPLSVANKNPLSSLAAHRRWAKSTVTLLHPATALAWPAFWGDLAICATSAQLESSQPWKNLNCNATHMRGTVVPKRAARTLHKHIWKDVVATTKAVK